MKHPTIRIDPRHSKQLIAGVPITFKVPLGAETITLELGVEFRDKSQGPESIAKILDVFFNGRKA